MLTYMYEETSINHVVNFLDIFDPHPQPLCYKIVIWHTYPHPPYLSQSFMDAPKETRERISINVKLTDRSNSREMA